MISIKWYLHILFYTCRSNINVFFKKFKALFISDFHPFNHFRSSMAIAYCPFTVRTNIRIEHLSLEILNKIFDVLKAIHLERYVLFWIFMIFCCGLFVGHILFLFIKLVFKHVAGDRTDYSISRNSIFSLKFDDF